VTENLAFAALLNLIADCRCQPYNAHMKIVNFPGHWNQIGASGECPHCATTSYFKPVSTYSHKLGEGNQMVSAAQCESCKNFVLVIGKNRPTSGKNDYWLENVFPLGKPNDTVDPAVPANIAEDFREALRCEWVKSYKGAVTMCRRAVQASALELGANPKKKLVEQIDELLSKGKITEPLKDFAHEVRLGGNDGAHPSADGLENVSAKDAEDIVAFTREFLHHVYVMPAKLKARKASQSSNAAQTP
jgi:hypothetical protein